MMVPHTNFILSRGHVSTKHHSKKSRVAKVGFNSRGRGATSRESLLNIFEHTWFYLLMFLEVCVDWLAAVCLVWTS